ncbi:MAG: rod shape-determining protein RodA [Fibrobacter sp.]|jgi:rod shape determining protein RodA|nr:rod shape-determining protein RodA [Fibrobacter sp.]
MMEIKRKGSFDFPLFFLALSLWIIGIFLIYSATYFHESGPLAGIYKQQIIWVAMAIFIIMAIISIPGRLFYGFAYIFYAISVVMLVMALVMGVSAKGAERWIIIAGFKLQPSEFAKIGLLLALARYLSEKTVSLERITSFIIPGLLIGVPFLLVLKQPDLGTAGVFCAMSLPMFFWGGLTVLEVFYIISPLFSLVFSAIPLILSFGSDHGWGIVGAIPWGFFFLTLCAILYFARPSMFIMIGVVASSLFTATITTVVWNSFLKDYQKMRIISFINPQADPFGAGYQVIQSKVAVGSGHLFGKGFLKGTQSKLSYLPEQHTDFIFSVLGEQFGIVGCTIVILLFLLLIVRGLILTQSSRNRFFNLVMVGSVSIIGFHVFVNTAMTIGMMPVTGIPLSFLSYGGSFVLTMAIIVGLMLNTRASDHDF